MTRSCAIIAKDIMVTRRMYQLYQHWITFLQDFFNKCFPIYSNQFTTIFKLTKINLSALNVMQEMYVGILHFLGVQEITTLGMMLSINYQYCFNKVIKVVAPFNRL